MTVITFSEWHCKQITDNDCLRFKITLVLPNSQAGKKLRKMNSHQIGHVLQCPLSDVATGD